MAYQQRSGGNRNGGQPLQTVTGVVEGANDKGIKVNGTWYNFSNYLRTDVYPEIGGSVVLGIANGKFINELDLDDGSAPTPIRQRQGNGGQRPQGGNGGQGSYQQRPQRTEDPARQQSIIRQTAIKAAADLLSGSGATADEAIAVAQRFVDFVNDTSSAPSNDDAEGADDLPF